MTPRSRARRGDGAGGGASSAAGGFVRVRGEVRAAILDHARRALPDECCGLLIGAAGPGETRVTLAWPARNLRRSPTRYLVDPADHFAAIRAARRCGLAVVGAYHSHPASAPLPSATDTREADDTELLYVIASPVQAAVRAYRLVDGRLRRAEMRPDGQSEKRPPRTVTRTRAETTTSSPRLRFNRTS